MSLERCFSRPLYASLLKGESLKNKTVTRGTSSDLQLSHDLLFTLYCLMFYRLLIEYTEDKGNDAVAWKGYVYVVCFLVVQAFQVSLTQHSLHISFTSAMRVHSSIIGAVYNKVKATPLGTEMMKVNHSNTPLPPRPPSHDGNCISCFLILVSSCRGLCSMMLLMQDIPCWYYLCNHAVPPPLPLAYRLFYRYPLPFVTIL